MPEFRRLPDWDQRADRGTRLTDPVVTVRQLSRFGFARRPLTRIDHALVFSAPDGSYDTYLPPLRPTRAGAAAKRYTAVYEVDMGVHPVREEITLPSDDDAFEFAVAVELSWQVVDPARFVASRHRDVPRLLVGELERAARAVTRRFPVSRSAAAEEALLREVHAQGVPGARAGLTADWTVRLRGDREVIDHVRRMRSIDHEATEQIRAEHLGREHDAAIDRRVREQDVLQSGRAAEFEEQQHRLRLRQQRWQHTEEVDRARARLELQQVNEEKIAFYEKHLEQGGVRAWALLLADRPGDISTVVASLRQDQLEMIKAQLELAKELLKGDSAEGHELEAPKVQAFQAMVDVLDQRLPGVTARSTAGGRLTVSMPQDAPGTEAPRYGGPSPSPFPGWHPPPGYGSTPLEPNRAEGPAEAPDTAEPGTTGPGVKKPGTEKPGTAGPGEEGAGT
ncbi:hypothetical protein [Streptomyces sp. NPDC057496]|uniref:hypothetical protein n=1 Tax=Streptomyces sp. NPDC057496 TaxID=3346149 RepID=UPI003697F682